MTLLGVDYGSKRIGLAKSDEAEIMAHGIGFIECRKDSSEIENIRTVIQNEKIRVIVVGHPLNMNGSAGPKAREAEKFAEKLSQAVGIKVILWDERLTSKEAERYLIEANTSRAKRKKKIDQLAAQIMLQGYIDAEHSKRKR